MSKLRVVVDRPCVDPSVTFEERPEGRFCLACGELQHDLTGATCSEALALIRAHGGRLCGTFRASPGGEVVFRPEAPARGLAAHGAALALALAGCGTASEPTAPPASSPPTSIAAPPTEVTTPPPTTTTPTPPPELAVDHSTDASLDAEDHAGHAHTHEGVLISGMHLSGGATVAHFDDDALDDVPRGSFHVDSASIDATGEGEFDARVLVRMIQTRRGAIQACYERELRSDPTVAGRISVRLTVEPSGPVAGVALADDTLTQPAVGACVVRVVQGFRFSPGPDGGAVTYTVPLTFQPAG